MTRLQREPLAALVTNERLVTTLVSLTLARPDLAEAFGLVAAAFGVRRTYQSEIEEAAPPLIFVERVERRLEVGGSTTTGRTGGL